MRSRGPYKFVFTLGSFAVRWYLSLGAFCGTTLMSRGGPGVRAVSTASPSQQRLTDGCSTPVYSAGFMVPILVCCQVHSSHLSSRGHK